MNLTITAREGDEIVLDATVFVPEVEEGEGNLPSLLGWQGCLERLRFAIDPSKMRLSVSAPPPNSLSPLPHPR
jgi:hypothetical protein